MSTKMHVRLDSASELLLNCPECVNPTHPITLAKASYTSKKKKTLEDQMRITDLDFLGSIYHQDKVTLLPAVLNATYPNGILTFNLSEEEKAKLLNNGIYLPSDNIEAMIRDGAKHVKKGKAAEASILVTPYKVPVIYDGPRDLESLVKDMTFRDVRNVGIKKARILKCRPRIDRWALEFDVEILTDVLNVEDVQRAIVTAGQLCALGDYRPKYGRFTATFS